jgi:hypothetical protein
MKACHKAPVIATLGLVFQRDIGVSIEINTQNAAYKIISVGM